MTRFKRTYRYLAAVIVAVAFVGAGLFLFREEREEHEVFGHIVRQWRWGRPAFLHADVNRDGTIDYRQRVAGTFDRGVPPLEFWEEPCGDGRFRYHVMLTGKAITAVEADEHCTGTYDLRLEGNEAEAFYQRLVESRRRDE